MAGHKKITLKSVELFAGGGGMALGAHQAGVSPIMFLEWEKNSCQIIFLRFQWLTNANKISQILKRIQRLN